MPPGEGAPELTAYKQAVSNRAKRPEPYLVVHYVPDQRAGRPIPHLTDEFVPVMPGLERPLDLQISKEVVDFALCDPGYPSTPEA
jgi:hypothetical protein